MRKEEELINKFIELEFEIVEKLKTTEMQVDFDADRKSIISTLKKYVAKVKSLEKLFDEYEGLAKKIELLTGEEESKQSATNAVVELREDSEQLKEEIGILSETLNEIQNMDGNIVVKKKRKKSSDSVKEM